MSKTKRNNRFKANEMDRLGGNCPFCGVAMTTEPNCRNSVTYDHVVSPSRGGSESLANGQVMCGECNQRKGSHSLEYFVKHRMWAIERGPRLTLLNTQRHATQTGDLRAMAAMGKMCLAKGL